MACFAFPLVELDIFRGNSHIYQVAYDLSLRLALRRIANLIVLETGLLQGGYGLVCFTTVVENAYNGGWSHICHMVLSFQPSHPHCRSSRYGFTFSRRMAFTKKYTY